MKRMMFLTCCIFIILSIPINVYAAPQLINYQGNLTGDNNIPLEGSYAITINIYDSTTGGTLLWGPQTFPSVPVVNGKFNIILGPQDQSSRGIDTAFSTDTVYLEITVGSNPPVSPRQQILSTPFSFNSNLANDVQDGSITSAKIIDGAISSSHIADGAVTTGKIAESSVAVNQIADSSITRAKLKTSYGEASGSGTIVLPGGEYAFYPQTRCTSDDCHIGEVKSSIFQSTIYLGSFPGGISGCTFSTTRLHVRFVTSSGEVHWLFLLKAKKAYTIAMANGEGRQIQQGETVAGWYSSDHPCLGNGGNPSTIQHPFRDYDPELHEIVVVNPTIDQIHEIENKCDSENENQSDRSFFEVLAEDYDIDLSEETPWPSKPVTVGLPRNHSWQSNPEKYFKIRKKMIPKPSMVRTARLKKKS